MSSLCLAAAAAMAPAMLMAAGFTIPRHETYGTDFKLDGRPFESAWTNAPLRDFCFVFKDKGVPANRTSMRAFYDVDALYVAFYCHEGDMKRLQPGFPPDQATDVPIASGSDCIEFLVSPPGAENTFFHLRVVPSGAKADSRCTVLPDKSCMRDATWNGSWQAKTYQDDKAWYAELRIPFSDLSKGLFGVPVATPTHGVVWRINAGRTESPKGETTAFSRPGLYHLTMEDVAFAGFPWGDIKLSAPKHPMTAGEHSLPLTIENRSGREATLQVSAAYSEEERDPEKRREALRECRWKKPMRRSSAYDGTVTLAPRAATNVTARFAVSEADAGLQTLCVNVNWLRMKHNCSRLWLTGGDDPGVRRRKLDSEGPAKLAGQLADLAAAHPGDTFALGSASVYEKVFRDLPYEGSFKPEARIALAQNEYETAQFVVFRLKDGTGPITVTPPRLVGPDGAEIPASAIEVHHVGFINVGDSGHNMHRGYWPDILYPETVLPVPRKGRVQSVLVTVKAPVDQRPGDYRGKVGFATEDGERHEGSLVVEVYPFSLPDRMTLGVNFWYHGVYPARFYDKDPVTGVDFDEMMTLCGKYRFANFLRGNLLAAALRVRLDPAAEDGYRFDFSLMDKYQDIACRNGANTLNFDVGWSKHHRIVYGQNGQMQFFKPADPKKASARLFRELREHYKKKGYWKFAQLQVGDEPWGEKAQADIRERVAKLREKHGEIPPVITAGSVRNHTNLDGFVDLWCPQFPQYDPKDYRDMKPNERLWLYQCLYKDDFPSYQIDRPAIEPRITGLICRKTGARGFLYWTSVQWSSEQEWKSGKSKDRWVHEDWSLPIKPCPGDGCFTYPTKDRVVPSLRAVYIRDGIEDYEYLAELERRYEIVKKAGGTVPLEVDRLVKRLLAVPDEVVRATNEWTHDTATIERFRDEVAHAMLLLKEWYNK